MKKCVIINGSVLKYAYAMNPSEYPLKTQKKMAGKHHLTTAHPFPATDVPRNISTV
jgi:hypothetical protein